MPSTLRPTDWFDYVLRPSATPWSIRVRVPCLQITLGFPSMITALDLVWTHDGLSVTFGRSRGVNCLANNSLFPLSLTTLTTHSLGTDWYVIMELEPVCQNSRPASCAADKWIQYTASYSGLQWVWHCTFRGFVVSVTDSASSASLLNGSRGVKKIVFLPSLRSLPPATDPISAVEYHL